MWSQSKDVKPEAIEPEPPKREALLIARLRMIEALALLDEHSLSAAAASLDLAIHQLDRELSGG